MDDCDVESEPGPLKQRPRLSESDDTAGLYRVFPFTVSLFSGDALSTLPQMDAKDYELFLQSLKAQTAPELVKTARLWEGELLQRYPVPFFLVRVGDIRAALNSTATALILYKEVRLK
ncbi:hypothetical protein PILCRDRAFT_455046 [Piloderma croceum F 1598]|uniref:Uncharacterized protein n=1 Tax=Piloderma croceum (strain F 1598) TaxID=765440 RepID=A0A0C3BZD9_PILCF|nr:hypothetical protein PILCRDRAFT_455046 [Piloderma croceum F 1598]